MTAPFGATLPVLRCRDLEVSSTAELVTRYGLTLQWVADEAAIPGSYWGDAEAGIIGLALFVRADTPVHSMLHELCHVICMDSGRRHALDTDSGGDYAEEDAVCYLQILLSEYIPDMGRDRMLADMDCWGYTFRLGSAREWFLHDAADARDWLLREGLIDTSDRPLWRLRP